MSSRKKTPKGCIDPKEGEERGTLYAVRLTACHQPIFLCFLSPTQAEVFNDMMLQPF